jgi:2-polyprenyl-3-methyl-5-hydroxy-6-metoxy-1,4-benzoquinol methylase
MTARETEGATVCKLEECPVCGNTGFKALPTPGHWIGLEVFAPLGEQVGLSKCRSCGFIFTNPRPAPQLLDQFYSGYTYSCHKPVTSEGANRKAAFLLSLLKQAAELNKSENRLLDFGCGGGFLLRYARDAGWDASGFDPGSEAVRACRSQGLTVFDCIDKLPSGGFDAITLIHVLEHVVDHAGLFAVFERVLAPLGRLLIEVPNAQSLRARLSHPLLTRHAGFDERYRAFPIHLSYFTPETLTRLLEKHGFQVSMTSTCGMSIEEIIMRPEQTNAPTSQSISPAPTSSATSRRSSAPVRAVKNAAKALIYGSKLGENVVLIARAPLRQDKLLNRK